MGNFPQHFPQEFPTRYPARFSCNSLSQDFLQDFPTRISHKISPQDFPVRISCKNFPSWILIGWLPITLFQMLNFHQSLPFLNWLFLLLLVPQEFPATISCKIFPQEFPTKFPHKIFPQEFPELDPDWLAPHHPIPNAKFPPITALLNRPTYHKRSKVSPTTLSPNLMGTPNQWISWL